MQYWDNVTRSFRIAWRHKYLWLIALFSGEGGAGFNSSFNQGTGSRTGTPSTAQIQQQVTTWVSEHVGLIVFLIVLWVVLAVAFFILAAVCEGATVRAAAEHDAERPFGLGWAWRSGVATMWVIIRFRLLLLALILPVVLILAGLVFGAVASIANNSGGASVGFVLPGILLGFPFDVKAGTVLGASLSRGLGGGIVQQVVHRRAGRPISCLPFGLLLGTEADQPCDIGRGGTGRLQIKWEGRLHRLPLRIRS